MTSSGMVILSADAMRQAERASAIPLDALMSNAGRALAEAAWRFGSGAPILILCGPGNNGGDGYAAASALADRGAAVRVAASGPPQTELAKRAAAGWAGDCSGLADAGPAPVLVDALFGTGVTRAVPEAIANPLHRLGRAARLVIAADLPSGVGTDDGHDFGAHPAHLTIAMGAFKPAHFLQPAASLCGHVLRADIGICAAGLVDCLARPRLHAPAAGDHKYSRGMVAIVAGDMPGAATLACLGAARLSGYTILCGNGEAPPSIVRRGFEATMQDDRLSALLIGPGLSDTVANRERLGVALASPAALVIDAGALALVNPEMLRHRTAATVITPHQGEFERLFGRSAGSKLDRALDAADRAGVTLILKGSDTVIASPGGRATLARAASSWLASAGTGDVLAGIVAALLGNRHAPHDAACAAVWLHAEAARRAGPALMAGDLPGHLSRAVAACL